MTISEADVLEARANDDKLNKAIREREAHESEAQAALDEHERLSKSLKNPANKD